MSTGPKLSRAQLRALDEIADGGLTPIAAQLFLVRRKTLDALALLGLIRFRPYARPPCWRLTPEGRATLDELAKAADATGPQATR